MSASNMTSPPKRKPERKMGWLLRAVPITLQPKLLALKNRYFKRRVYLATDLFGIGVTALLMFCLYLGTDKSLLEIRKANLPSEISLNILQGFALGLFSLILISATVTGLSSLFMARDVDLLLSAPVSSRSFLRGKVSEVLISTTWMIVVFCLPPYLSVGAFYNSGVTYYIAAPLLLGIFLLLAVLCGMTLSIFCACVIPARAGRNVFVALFVMVLGFLLALCNGTTNSQVITKAISNPRESIFLKFVDQPLLPSTWLAQALNAVSGDTILAFPYPQTAALCGLIIAMWYVLSCVYQRLYHLGYNRLHAKPRACLLFTRGGESRRRIIIPGLSQATRAMATRELFSFTRELAHTIQLAMFLTICVVYFINFQSISSPTNVGPWVLRAWDLIALSSFLVISSLIILSICSRFVFPSVSLEGSSLWILQIAPIDIKAILRAKYFSWATPIGFISAVLFSSAGLALALEPLCILALAMSAFIITHGLVSLGIGIGARFSRFDWEHPAELAMSWGGLIYLVLGLFVVCVSFIPLGAMFGGYIFFPAYFQTTANLVALLTCGIGSLLLINLVVGKISTRIGVSAMHRVFQGVD